MTLRSWLRACSVALAFWPGCRPLPDDRLGQAPAAGGRDAEAARMVDRQLRANGIADARVLAAMRRVPRHLFVPADQQAAAYVDGPLPIGFGQTISQPYIVAFMTEALALRPDDVVLEIGTGSGYQAAVLGELAREVYTIELVPELAERARATLAAGGYDHVQSAPATATAAGPSARRSPRSSSPPRPTRCRRRSSISWRSAAPWCCRWARATARRSCGS